MNAKPSYMTYYNYLSVVIRVTIWVCEFLTLLSDWSRAHLRFLKFALYKFSHYYFRYQYLKVYWSSINTKSWVKDVIQTFKVLLKRRFLNTEMSWSTIKIKKKTKLAKFPVIPARISEIPGNSRTGIPGGLALAFLERFLLFCGNRKQWKQERILYTV